MIISNNKLISTRKHKNNTYFFAIKEIGVEFYLKTIGYNKALVCLPGNYLNKMISLHITDRLSCGGILLPLDTDVVIVSAVPSTRHTPLLGHFEPVRAVMPI